MNRKHLCLTSAAFTLFASLAVAQPEARILPAFQDVGVLQPAGKEKPKQPDKDKKPVEPPLIDLTPPVRSSEFARGYNPQMLGDIFGVFAMVRAQVAGTQTIVTQTANQNAVPPAGVRTTINSGPATQNAIYSIPYAIRGGFKVAENASPMPVDRFFFTYNYFNSVRDPRNGPTDPASITTTTTQQVRGNVIQTTTTSVFPRAPFVDLHREVFGMEKTFLDGRASVEVRLPLLQQIGSMDDFRSAHLGDITILGKYAFLLNRETGKVVSGGLAVTAPTGPGIDTIDGRIHSTLLQPWGGYVCPFGRFYLHGFHSIVVPTDSRDVTLAFNDVGVGYFLYRGEGDRPLRFIVPTAEVHVTTPLTHRDGNGAFVVPDMVALTGGVHVGLFRSSVLSIGASSPLTSPRTYAVEGFVQLNWRY